MTLLHDPLEALREATDALPESQPWNIRPDDDQLQRELARLEAAESGRINRNVPITPYEIPHRVNGTSAPCLLPIRVVVYADNHPEFRVKRCMRWRCGGCRPLVESEMADRITNGFAGQDAWVEDVHLDTWDATKKRLNRRGVDYVKLPINRPGVVTVLSTSPASADAVKVPDLEMLVADVLAKRPKTRGGARISASRDFLPKSPRAASVADDPLANGEPMGTWDHRVSLNMLEEMCNRIGVPFERHRPKKPTQTDRLVVLTDWNDERWVQVRRWCGFAYPDHTLETDDDWLSWLIGEEVPWDVIVAYEEGAAA